jgi:hypothetical protein
VAITAAIGLARRVHHEGKKSTKVGPGLGSGCVGCPRISRMKRRWSRDFWRASGSPRREEEHEGRTGLGSGREGCPRITRRSRMKRRWPRDFWRASG